MRFSLGELDVVDKFGILIFFNRGDSVSGDQEDEVGPINVFGWKA